MDAKYRWVGYQLYRLQGTQFPRGNVSTFLRGLPPALTNAACMLTNRALDKALLPDPVTDASGQQVTQVTEKIGPIETSKTFKPAAGAKDLAPEYPEVTLMLQGAGLIRSGNCGEIGRA